MGRTASGSAAPGLSVVPCEGWRACSRSILNPVRMMFMCFVFQPSSTLGQRLGRGPGLVARPSSRKLDDMGRKLPHQDPRPVHHVHPDPPHMSVVDQHLLSRSGACSSLCCFPPPRPSHHLTSLHRPSLTIPFTTTVRCHFLSRPRIICTSTGLPERTSG